MTNVTSIIGDSSVQSDPKRGIDKPLDRFLWEDFSIFVIDDQRFFSRDTLRLAVDLYEVAAQRRSFILSEPDGEGNGFILRLSEREERVVKAIHDAIKKMPEDVFDEYFDRFLEEIASDSEISTAKCSVFARYLETVGSEVDSDKGFDGSLVEVSKEMNSFAIWLEGLTKDGIRDAIKKSQRASLDIFTDELISGTIVQDVIDDMVEER